MEPQHDPIGTTVFSAYRSMRSLRTGVRRRRWLDVRLDWFSLRRKLDLMIVISESH